MAAARRRPNRPPRHAPPANPARPPAVGDPSCVQLRGRPDPIPMSQFRQPRHLRPWADRDPLSAFRRRSPAETPKLARATEPERASAGRRSSAPRAEAACLERCRVMPQGTFSTWLILATRPVPRVHPWGACRPAPPRSKRWPAAAGELWTSGRVGPVPTRSAPKPAANWLSGPRLAGGIWDSAKPYPPCCRRRSVVGRSGDN